MGFARRDLRVLVVEDDRVVLRLLARALRRETDAVTACLDATAAAAAVASEAFDAAAIDLNLPDGSGLDIIRDIRARHPAAGIVAVTGHVGVDVAVQSMQAGADDFLTKPFEIDLLWHILNKAEESRRGKIEAERATAYRVLAYTDTLTGVPNRRFIDESLSSELERAAETGQPLTVAYFDIDNFKLLNDFAGHVQGDLVLQACAETLRAELPESAIFGRFGGDEFVALFPGTDLAEATGTARRVSSAVAAFTVRGTAFPIATRLSVGVAEWDRRADPRALLAEAEGQMYVDKSVATFAMDNAAPQVYTSPIAMEQFRTLRGLVKAIDRRDAYTRFHSDHATGMALEVGRRIGLPERDLIAIVIGGPIHDLGKLVVPDEILRKPGPLTREERRSMEDHPVVGAIIAAAVTDVAEVVDLIRHHHERFDGSGYPAGLRHQQAEARVRLFALADAFSAMITDRPYRRALPWEVALNEIRQGLGTQFDPDIGREFLDVAANGRDAFRGPDGLEAAG